jgi:hypothetical protein
LPRQAGRQPPQFVEAKMDWLPLPLDEPTTFDVRGMRVAISVQRDGKALDIRLTLEQGGAWAEMHLAVDPTPGSRKAIQVSSNLDGERGYVVVQVLAAAGQAGQWQTLYVDEQWYKDHKQPEQVFTGTLERHKDPEVSTLMRSHRYKLGDRFLYPGKENPDLEKLVGQKVEVRGKPYDVNLEGQAVSEIWPAAIRAVAESAGDPKTATLDKALEAWIDLLETDKVEAAQKQWAKDDGASGTIKQWWAKLRDCHKEYDYRKWLEQAKKIGDATKFKVGGHDYGYMHVDWEKADQGWRIAKVWMCR